MRTFAIVNFGCQMNEYESEKFREVFYDFGLVEVSSIEEADIVLFNSCAVREKSEQKLISSVGYARSLYEKYGRPYVIVSGCVASIKERKIKEVARDSLFMLSKGYELIYERVNELRSELSKYLNANNSLNKVEVHRVFAYVPVIFGCNSFCAYCIVPATKGREKSRPINEVLDEVKSLVDQGVKEIVLLGQNINHYGYDLGKQEGFIELLEEVGRIPNLKRLRYLTPHPAYFTKELVKRMRRIDTLMPHFHLPVQSGSNKILSLMKRGYTKEHYLEIIETIKKEFPEASITTDIIVGFPNESEEDFLETINLVKTVQFDKSFIAAYSKRPNTPAATMEGQIDPKTKKERLNYLLKIQNEISLEKNKAYIGGTYEVLVENVKGNKAFGRIPQDKLVIFESSFEVHPGDLANVLITDADFIHLRGKA
ncbi:MAG: tRNA (N6-isopentenyl adenosine(37)-C2)-methylthiotransferase MiaB [Caldisericum exile]|uniref:tRNA-2-methylthio-N(6)-dimethylallyladenosine synthase n=1 Tax=Caldisericum exile TaxID=693075 RepID=A0A2J6X4A1_9BACT|nr:MAG: tRNA (N6-isopentenyl adenosine(37)-C2)-methylthiotransferase MiaB [Caldisericum exile]